MSDDRSDERDEACLDRAADDDPLERAAERAGGETAVNGPGVSQEKVDKAPSSLTDQLGGIAWVVAGGVFFTGMAALVKLLSADIPAAQLIFVRMAIPLVVLVPLIVRDPQALIATKSLHLHLIRVALGLVAITSGVYALILLPLAEATALSFTRAMFVTILAVLFLSEPLGLRRWGAVFVGFVGVLVILRPDSAGFSLGALLALTSACAVAGVRIAVKRMTATEATTTILLFPAFFVTLFSAIPAAMTWVWPGWLDGGLLLAMALLGLAGQWCVVNGYRKGDATLLAPFDYIRILFASLFGYLLFAQIPTIWTICGAIIIVGSTLYVVHRERMVARQKLASSPPIE